MCEIEKTHDVSLTVADNNAPSHQDKGKFRTNTLDQFYTSDRVAGECIGHILSLFPYSRDYLWIEPSAGNGAFLRHIDDVIDKIGIDIDPKAQNMAILKQDFLTWSAPIGKPIIVFGNPPFGRQSALAKSFIKRSCEFARIIAFILPKSFTKPSMNCAFDVKFHCMFSIELEKNSFILNGAKYDVPCVFQIWCKQEDDRVIEAKIEPRGFHYVKNTDDYNIAFRRVGVFAGKCHKNDGTKYSIQSHHFLKFDDNVASFADTIIEKINAHEFPSNTVGPRSLSKTEINTVINDIIASVCA